MSAPLSPSLAKAFASAAQVVARVVEGQSLTASLVALKATQSDRALVAAAQDLSYNALRGYGIIDVAVERLVDRPVMDPQVRALLITASAELAARPDSAHAVVHQAVEATITLGVSRAKGMVNAVLRNFQRRMKTLMAEIESTDTGRHRHPQWWINRLRRAYPGEWESILADSNRHAPMTLRVNSRRSTALRYVERLALAGMGARQLGAAAVLLDKPCRVELLPGFAEGEVSVQDAGAQAAAPLLDVRDGMRVLDACAAPGGKTGHVLELAECQLTAVDSDATRIGYIRGNLSRLGVRATVLAGDTRNPASFWDGVPFDRILLDAPCSSSGAVRRHPDIKWLRREGDIAAMASVQAKLLDAAWKMLGFGGRLLYATCSLFPEENAEQVSAFLERRPDAERLTIALQDGVGSTCRIAHDTEGQILTSEVSDGFYYALLRKTGSGA